MRSIRLIAVGRSEIAILDELAAVLARIYRVSCHVETAILDPGFAFDAQRGQYYSTRIVARLAEMTRDGETLLGVTECDLFVPVLTYIFGEAQLGGRAGLVSLHRLREEFYGLPPNPPMLLERLVKEAVHELGHTFGLRHCPDWSCAMASTHAVERLDIKSPEYCQSCRRAAGLPAG